MKSKPRQMSHDDLEHQGDLTEGWFIYTIKQLELGLRAPLEQATQGAGLTTAQFTALAVLSRWPGLTSSELARRSFVRAQTMAQTIAPLLSSGYIHRQDDPANGRRMRLSLTPEGLTALDSIRGSVSSLEADFLSELLPQERENFAAYMRACRSTLARLPR